MLCGICTSMCARYVDRTTYYHDDCPRRCYPFSSPLEIRNCIMASFSKNVRHILDRSKPPGGNTWWLAGLRDSSCYYEQSAKQMLCSDKFSKTSALLVSLSTTSRNTSINVYYNFSNILQCTFKEKNYA